MPVMMQGTIPYPPNAEARPIIELATQLRELGQLFTQQSGQIRQTAATATSTWSGQAAGMFVQNMTGRADTVSDVGRLLGQAATPLQAFAAAITTTQATYSAAATAEQAARAGLPWTAGALAAAIAAEQAAVLAHQAAGFAAAGGVGRIVAQIAIKEFFGGRRNGGRGGTGNTGDRGDGEGGIIDTVFDWIFGEDEQPATATTGGNADRVPLAPAPPAQEPAPVDTPPRELTDAEMPVGGNRDVRWELPESGTGYTTYNRNDSGLGAGAPLEFRRRVGGGNVIDQIGTRDTIDSMERIASDWNATNPDRPLQYGDVSLPGGVDTGDHATHTNGRGFDMRPLRNDGEAGRLTFRDAAYDRELTREFIRGVQRDHPGSTVYFNDPEIANDPEFQGVVRTDRRGIHDNHLHVELPAPAPAPAPANPRPRR